jgi:hypothetical protein
MPPLNWSVFQKLPGSAEYNFEMLCRATIRRHYGRYGQFVALANQPGVEFHLKLHTSCTLGRQGQWFGWQCRWYDLPGGKALGNTRRQKIQQAIITTEKVLPDITDWILWTRRPLAKSDQTWFYALKTHMRLHLWTTAEIEEHLSGDAEILRSVYFGELVLDTNNLLELHGLSVTPIRRRWQQEVHQTMDVERTVRRMLGETGTWDNLQSLSDRLKTKVLFVQAEIANIPASLSETTIKMLDFALIVANALADTRTVLTRGDLDIFRQQLSGRPGVPSQEFLELPRKLRAKRSYAGLQMTNILADIRSANNLIDKVDTYLGKKIIAIVADAGCGKTQLAAQLTAAGTDRPAGILFHGRDLLAGHNLDDLAGHVVLHGKRVSSMEALLSAFDAAGQRTHRRLPIVIDGLNEAEDPRDWKNLLASVNEVLNRYPYVFLICTLRPAFIDEALPPETDRRKIQGFAHDTVEAIQRYFAYYLINATDAEVPVELLSHPLTLRLFCEVTNPNRDREVGVEAIPASLTALFDRYLNQAAQRITELAPRTRRYYEQDVRTAFDEIGICLWQQSARGIDEHHLRENLGDRDRPWNESIIHLMEQEGIILRFPKENASGILVTAAYDALAGHLIADAILTTSGRTEFERWMTDAKTLHALAGPLNNQHPLATDIFRGLVGLLPRRLHRKQLWTLLKEPLQTTALWEAAKLEGSYLDAETVEALATHTARTVTGSHDMFNRLWHTRGAPPHPLNAEFLDSFLRPMAICLRDMSWTEWIRHNSGMLLDDLEQLGEQWRTRAERSFVDRLRAQWVTWMLTSTVHKLRDYATHALYWFGRKDPEALFNMTIKALSINDPYVSERMLAASYGVAMALQHENNFVVNILPAFAQNLYDVMFRKGAPSSTTHILTRDYAKHIIDIALLHNNKILARKDRERTKLPFTDGGIRKWGKSRDKNVNEYRDGNYPFGFNFDNYTIGRLLPERHNYDFNNPEYVEVKSNMWWRIYQLGYSLKDFGEIDKGIVRNIEHRSGRGADGSKTDTYGKKCNWIAWHEIAGVRQDKGLLKREWDSGSYTRINVDIDPSFPDKVQNIEIIRTSFLGERIKDVSKWIVKGSRPDLRPYTLLEKIQDEDGPWVLLDGYIEQEDLSCKRDIFIFPRGFLVKRGDFNEIVQRLHKQDLGGRWLPEIPELHYIFAGEIPWCESFPYNGREEISFVEGRKQKRVPFEKIEVFKDGKALTGDELKKLFRLASDLRNKKMSEEDANSYLVESNIEIRRKKCYRIQMEETRKKYEVTIPVATISWGAEESAVNPGGSAYVLSRELCETLALRSRPQTFDLFDLNNRRATITLKWGSEWHTFYKLIYVRKDLLDKALLDNELDLIWSIWGERRFKSKANAGLEEFAKKYQSYKQFQTILTYRDVVS